MVAKMTGHEGGNAVISSLEEGIAAMIETAAANNDQRMPTERALAQHFATSRHAVRQALERLELRGAIWRQVGRGTFSGRRSDHERGAARPGAPASRAEFSQVDCSPRDIREARRMLEPSIASLAAAHATGSQLAEIMAAHRRCAAARNMDAYEVFDEAFHRAIAQACGNLLVITLFEQVNRMRKEVVWGAMRRAILKPERRAHFSAEHGRIADAIASRDTEGAWQASMEHMATISAAYDALRPGEPFAI
jgi:DNA-binding FadR family transcriptional regulator